MDPGEALTDSVNTTVRDGVWAGSPTLTTSSTPWPFREAPWRPMASQTLASPPRGSSTPCPQLPAQAEGLWVWELQSSFSVEISAWSFPSITFYCLPPSDLLKQCVSYRFCLLALTSLCCFGKQTFSIYRSAHLTKRNLEAWTSGCSESPLLEPEDVG